MYKLFCSSRNAVLKRGNVLKKHKITILTACHLSKVNRIYLIFPNLFHKKGVRFGFLDLFFGEQK